MFCILLLLMNRRCCYLGCCNFSAIIFVDIRISWNQNVYNPRNFFKAVSGITDTLINRIVFWTVFRTIHGTVLYGTVFFVICDDCLDHYLKMFFIGMYTDTVMIDTLQRAKPLTLHFIWRARNDTTAFKNKNEKNMFLF